MMELLSNTGELYSSPEFLEKLASIAISKKFEEGDVVLNEDSNIKAIPIVKSGSIRVMRTDESGKEILLYYIRGGESCIMSFLGGIHNETSKVKAIADEETEILFIPVDQVKTLIRYNPEWLDYIFRLYHKRFEELLEVVNAVAFKKVDERLLNLITLKCRNTNNKTLTVTHEQLANELGTARAVVSRLLGQLEEQGLVRLGRNKVTLL